MAGRWALFALRVGLFMLLLFAGWKLRAHVGETWTFVGSDGFFYLGAAEELRESQRYAMRPPQWAPERAVPQPLTYCRVPGLPIVMSWFAPPLPVKSYEPWYERIKPVQRVFDLGTCCLVFALGLSLFGWSVAWIGFLLALAHPVLAMYTASMFSETLATLLTTATLLLCAAAVTGQRSRRGFCALLFGGAACAGLATLTRIDGLILVAPLGLAPLLRSDSFRARLVQLGGAAAIFGLVLAPWLVRNQLAFGKPHLSGSLCDTQGQAVEQTGFARWMSTWLTQEEQLPTTLWCYLRVGCRLNVWAFPPEAFSSPIERRTVEQLSALRAAQGSSQRVDDGFAALAALRRRTQPYRTFISVPFERAKRLWLNKNDLPLRSTPPMTWPKFLIRVEPKLLQIALLIDELALCGMVFCLILPAFSAMRSAVLLLTLTILLRTAALAYTGSTEGRYLLEIVPVLLMFCGAAFAVPFRATSSFLR
jgi:hypothetical protein